MEILNNVVDIVSCLIESFLSLYISAKCLKQRKIKETYLIFIFYILMFIQSRYLQHYFLLQTTISIFLISMFCYKVLETKYLKGLLMGICINLGYGVISISYLSIMQLILGMPMDEMLSADSPYYILIVSVAKLTELLIGLLAANFVNKLGRFKLYQWIYIVFYYVMIFFGVCLSGEIMKNKDIPHQDKVIILVIMLMLIISNVATLFLVREMNRDNKVEIENELLTMQISEQTRLVERTSELYEEARTMRHNLKHYFVTMGEMLKNGQIDEVIYEMKKITDTQLAKVDIVNISNGYLNAAINGKLSECQQNSIQTEILVSGTIPDTISMDVVILLLNLFDNAIDAEKKIIKDNRFIRMALQQDGETIMFEIANFINESVLINNKELHTSKSNSGNHGMGIKSVKNTVSRLEGYINIDEKDNYFIVTVMLPIENIKE